MTNDNRYAPWLIRIHWLTLLLMVAVYATMELRGFFPRGSTTRAAMKEWHYALGLSVFALAWVRLALRWTNRTPPVVPAIPVWQSRLSAVVHAALYAIMLAMLGWLALSADGHAPTFYGIALPALIGQDKALAERFEQLHEVIGTVGYVLIGLHALAALVHHYVLRDNTLLRMLPRSAKTQ